MIVRILTLAVLIAAAMSSGYAQSLAGKWIGQASPQGAVSCWINERRQDGTYQLNFLLVAPTGNKRHREEGTWFFANGLYATVTHRINGEDVNPSDRRVREVYRVVELTDTRFVYADIGSGNQFMVSRVPDTFTLGEACPSTL